MIADAPPVDVIISTLDEERDIDACLDAVSAQTVPMRVTVVDGGSRDRTVALLRARAAREPGLQIVADGLRRTLPEALNLGLARTVLPFVAKVDARTFIAPDFLARAFAVLGECGRDVACAGGPPLQFGATPFGEGLARARMSRFGVGGSGYADLRERAEVDTVQCGVYRREALEQVGGFDPALQFGEDEELNWRLRQAGWRIIRDASIRFRYVTRSTWGAAYRQYRNYGRARVAVWRKHPGFVRPHHLAPSALVVAAAAALAAAPFSPLARRAAAGLVVAYAGAALVAASRASGGRLAGVPATAAAFTALHAGYGVGMLQGLRGPRP